MLVMCFSVTWSQVNTKKQRVNVAPGASVIKKVYEMTDEGVVMPKFPGGVDSLMNYFRTSLKYPLEAEKKGIEGRVLCSFVVSEDGSISDIETTKGVDMLLDNEAERVIRAMPNWTPGTKDGFPIKVHYTLPVNFRLNKKTVNRDSLKVAKTTEKQQKEVIENETPASFPGGVNALLTYLMTNLKYPAASKQANVQGRVVCEFIVNADGSISDIRVVKSVNPQLDAEAVRVIKEMPKWEPAHRGDTPIRMRYTLPVTFKL